MSLGFLNLPLWGCILLAFVPPALLALVGFRLSSKIEQKSDNLMTTLARFSGAALVLICAFLISTLWNQNTQFLEAWRAEYHAAQELQRSAALVTAGGGEAVKVAVDDYLRAVRDTEIQTNRDWVDLWRGSDAAAAALLEVQIATEATVAGLPSLQAKELRDGEQGLINARDARFERGIQPGTPLVILFVVLLLAWAAALSLSMYPMPNQRWVKVFQTCMVVFIVGMIQLPVYYLFGSGPVSEFVYGLIQV